MFGPQQGQGQGQGSNPYVNAIKDWWNNCPLFTKFLVYSTGGIYLISFFLSIIIAMMVNIPAYTFGSFQIWRLFTSPFCLPSIFDILFSYLAVLPTLTLNERESGTSRTILEFIIKNLEINIFFNIVSYLLSFLSQGFLLGYSYGLWNFFFIQLIKRVMQNPEGVSRIFCLPIEIKNKYYPWALFVLFSLLSGGMLRLDFLIAILLGYAHLYKIDDFFDNFFNQSRISGYENGCFKSLTEYPNFIPYGGGGSSLPMFRPPGGGSQDNERPQAPQREEKKEATPFQGKGVAIGGGTSSTSDNSSRSDRYQQVNDSEEL